jgi:branched-chain amino acid transport system ATP-binding protein
MYNNYKWLKLEFANDSAMLLQTKKLSKKYNGLTAVQNLDFQLKQDTTRAVIGPNGAGKTTMFNLLAGVIPPTSGTVEYRGDDITELDVHKRARKGIIKTFQITNIYESSTVLENVRVAAQAKYTTFNMYSKYDDVSAALNEAESILDTLGLNSERDTIAEALSHADRRKLDLGIALATDPEVLLLDEPTAGVEPEETEKILDILKRLSNDPSITIVITEHEMDVIFELADIVTVMYQGSILAEGKPKEITENSEVQRVYLQG